MLQDLATWLIGSKCMTIEIKQSTFYTINCILFMFVQWCYKFTSF